MRIICPYCKIVREIEHTKGPCNIECVCGKKFPLDKECIMEEFTEIDTVLPDHIGKYKILDLIGYGGMGKIYKAFHPDLQIAVALKSLKNEFANDERSCGRFIRSAKICARISHPNVVRIYDCNYAENGLFLVMEHLTGGSVQDILDEKGFLPEKETAEIIAGVCKGLIEAESRNIVHRDIKPENLMFDANGVVKILDLGLAKISNDARINNETRFAETIINTSLGTAEYMSPEQALDAKSCDCRSDIYSLGATMYHMLTGQYPFGTGDAAELKRKHALEELIPPSSLKENISPLMDKIICKCMAKNRSQRYQSARELYKDILAFLDGETFLPSFLGNRKKSLSFFRKLEYSFNSFFFRKCSSWETLAEEAGFLSPFYLLLIFLIMIFTAFCCAYFTMEHAPGLPVDLLLHE